MALTRKLLKGMGLTEEQMETQTDLGMLESMEVLQRVGGGSVQKMKFTGEKAMKNYLTTHPNFVKRYSDLIIDHISKTKASLNLLDDAILKEIYEQEAAVCPTEMTAAEALAADGVENE